MALKQREEAIISLVINGEQAKTSLKEVSGVVNALTADIRSMHKEDDPKLYEAKVRQLQRMRDAQAAMREEINGTTSAWQKFKADMLSTAAGVIGADAVESMMEKVLGFIPNMVERSAQLSDELSDIQKTTGMTSREVDLLNTRLSHIDTRTKSQELRDIAINAGQLGVVKEEVFGFTESIDKANVALGDEFEGGAGQVSDTLGKLRNIFSDMRSDKIDQDILHIGNALNTLGAEGLATAPVVSDFASRIGSVGIPLGLTSGQVLGLSATMQELNVNTERGSTAVVTLLQRMLTNTKDFAKVAGMGVGEFKKLLDTDLYGAFVKVVEGAGKSKDSATGFAAMLDKLKLDGAGTSQVISALSTNQTLLGTRVSTATEALQQQDSILSEFDLKNNNRAANLEKLGKKFGGLFASSSFDSLSDTILMLANKGIDALQLLISVMANLIKFVIAGTAALVAYNAVLFASTVLQGNWIKTLMATEAMTKLVLVAEQSWAAIKLVMTGRLREARNAMIGFNAVMEANPIGLVVAAVTALVVGILLFKQTADSAAQAQKKLNDIHEAAQSKIIDERDKINQLQSIIKDELSLREDKLTAIKKLREIMPDHLKTYDDEAIMAGKANIAVDQYIKTLEKKAAAEIAYEEYKKLLTDKRKVEKGEGDLDWTQWVGVVVTDMIGGQDEGQATMNEKMKKNKAAAFAAINAQIEAIKGEFAADFKKQALATPGVTPTVTGGGTSFGDDDLKKKRQTLIEESKRLSQEFKNFSAGELADLMATNEKEVKDTELKFEKMIQQEKGFINQKVDAELSGTKKIEDAKHRQEIDKLKKQKDDAVYQIRLRQEKEYLEAVEKLRTDMADRHESETQKEYNRINEFYDKELLKVGNNEKRKTEVEADRARDLADAKLRAEERLQKDLKEIQDQAPVAAADKDKVELARINKKYDDQVQALKEKYKKELGLTENYQKALDQIEKNRKAEIDLEKQEEDRKKKDAAIQIAQTISDAVFQIQANNRRAETDANLESIEKRRADELDKKNLTEKQKKAINDKYDAEIKAEKLRAWEADRQAALKQAIINTALAITKALPNPWAAAAAGIAGAAQVAVIVAEQPPKFATGVRKASEGFAYVGEAGPEIIEENGRLRYADKETLTYLQEGANVYNASDTAKIIAGRNTKSMAQVAFNSMNSSAAGVRFNSQSLSAGVDAYRFGSTVSTTSQPVPNPVAAPAPIDLAPLLEKMDTMIQAQKAANDKKVMLMYQDLEKFREDVERARIEAGK